MLEPLETGGSASLVIAWRAGKHVHGRTIRAGNIVTDRLREFAERTAALVAQGGGREYDPDDIQEDDTPYLEVPRDELIDTPLVDALTRGTSQPLASLDDLRGRPYPLACYALLLGHDPDAKTVFVRHKNPIHLATKSLVARWFDHALDNVDDPIFAFDDQFDVVITPQTILAINQHHFEMLFKDTDAVLSKASEWVDKFAKLLPITDDSKEGLIERLRTSSVIRRKMQSVLRKPHLHSLTSESLRAAMITHGMDPDVLLPEGKLVVDRANEREILQLLNEDLFAGDFSGEQYAAARKSRRI